MSSLKMTFSLASLILILGLVFVATPAMAQIDQMVILGTAANANFDTTENNADAITLAGGATAIPANGYLIIHKGTITPDAPTGADATGLPAFGDTVVTALWTTMPDLEEVFFGNAGGTIVLRGSKTALNGADTPAVVGGEFRYDHDGVADTMAEDVGVNALAITEIMWALDNSQAGSDDDVNKQWIEIFNRTDQNVPVAGLIIAIKSGTPPAISSADTAQDPEELDADAVVGDITTRGRTVLDWITNVQGNGWGSGARGQNGFVDDDGENRVDLVSMYRKRDKLGKTQGAALGHWVESSNVFRPGFKGTPGAVERSGPRSPAVDKPALTVVFNEVANFPDGDGNTPNYEWIELMVRSGDPNFKNWEVSLVTAADTEKTLFELPELNKGRIKGPDGDNNILLITALDPAGDPNHPLAAGYNIAMNDADQNSGIDPNIRYYVADWKMKLPDGGDFVLMLRNDKGKTNHEAIQDVAGYASDVEKSTATFYSGLWPLRGYAKPNFDRNKLSSGAVYRRQKPDIAGTKSGNGKNEKDHTAFRGAPDNDNGYKGVGYKRGAAATPQHGGTPGYPNGAIKDKESDLADGAMVTISEIMYQRGNRLPQWIELYNGSKTQGVNLNEWKLKIETNAGDADVDIRKPAVTIQFGGTIIPPMGTVLLTSTRATQATDKINVNHRIIDFWRTANIKSALEVAAAGRRYQLLSETAFKLTLMQKGGDVVDVAGNLGADGEAMWALPMMDEDAEGRSSIIRRYNTGPLLNEGENVGVAPEDSGTMPVWAGEGSLGPDRMEGDAGWVLASVTDLPFEATYYGDRDDMGTPNYRGGSPLPVALSKFRPERMKDTGAVVIRWITESELNNAGFNILRSETRDGEFTKINTKLIAGQGTTSERTLYEYADTSAKPNVVYYYQIQDVSLDGQVTTLRTTHLRGNVTAAGKLTTTWGELKALQ